MKIGFTGSRNGTTDHQRTRVKKLSHDDHMHWHARRFHVVGHVLCARAITVVNRDQSVAGRGELAVGDQARSATEFPIWFDDEGWVSFRAAHCSPARSETPSPPEITPVIWKPDSSIAVSRMVASWS